MLRTEALDLSRSAIRENRRILPRRAPILEEFAAHMASDAKRLEEDPDTGAQSYRYIKTGTNHFSLAFTYDCIAALRDYGPCHSATHLSHPAPLDPDSILLCRF